MPTNPGPPGKMAVKMERGRDMNGTNSCSQWRLRTALIPTIALHPCSDLSQTCAVQIHDDDDDLNVSDHAHMQTTLLRQQIDKQ